MAALQSEDVDGGVRRSPRIVAKRVRAVADQVHVALVAQLVERSPRGQSVVSLNPTQGSTFFLSLEKGVVLGGIELFALPLPC